VALIAYIQKLGAYREVTKKTPGPTPLDPDSYRRTSTAPAPRAVRRQPLPHAPMFRRILIEGWAHFVPHHLVCIFFVVFIAVTIRALRINKSERERLASLPLENNDTSTESEH